MTTNEKIAKVREKMAENKIDAVIVPSADPHMSEYFSDHWKTRHGCPDSQFCRNFRDY